MLTCQVSKYFCSITPGSLNSGFNDFQHTHQTASQSQNGPPPVSVVTRLTGPLTNLSFQTIVLFNYPAQFLAQKALGKVSKKIRFSLGLCPKLWVGGGQKSIIFCENTH